MLVLGAIAATSAASVMKQPALPALAPEGATKTTTGTFDGVEGLDDILSRIQQASRSVQFDDKAGIAPLGRDSRPGKCSWQWRDAIVPLIRISPASPASSLGGIPHKTSAMMNASHRDIDLSLANLTESAISANGLFSGIRFH